MLLAQFVPLSPSPAVSACPFSTSASLFCPVNRCMHLYHLSRFHTCALIYNLCFSLYDLLHSVWQTPCLYKWPNLVPLWGWVIFHCIAYTYHIFFIRPSVDGHLGCLHVLVIINSAAINTGVSASCALLNVLEVYHLFSHHLVHIFHPSFTHHYPGQKSVIVPNSGWHSRLHVHTCTVKAFPCMCT